MHPHACLRHLAALLLSAVCCHAAAAPTPPKVRAEIDALLQRLKSSGCEFERNRSWYTGAEAQAHLLRKLRYIEDGKETLASAEQFIAVAASSSSISGRPYQVRCGTAAPLRSQAWLLQQLEAIRAAARP